MLSIASDATVRTMPDTTTLELFAEISIGLVGFAGVVSALGRSRLPAPIRSFRISALLLYSITTLGGSLLPIVLLNYRIDTTVAWVASATVLAFAQLAILAWAARVIPPLVRSGQLPAPLALTISSTYLVVTLYLLFGIFWDQTSLSAIYLLVLLCSLSFSVFHFFMLVVSIQSVDP